jgi:hypothetical protein
MKILKKVPTIEVKRTFVIANFSKVKGNKVNTPEKVFVDKFKKSKESVLKLKETDLDKHIEWEKRLNAYNNSKWFLAEFSPSELGVWRRASDMPLRWTNQTLVETANKVKRAIGTNSKSLKKRSRYAVGNILKSSFHLSQKDKYSLPIVFKGSTGTKGRTYLKRKTKGDIDDGCMRSIALTISGKEKILVFYGEPKE